MPEWKKLKTFRLQKHFHSQWEENHPEDADVSPQELYDINDEFKELTDAIIENHTDEDEERRDPWGYRGLNRRDYASDKKIFNLKLSQQRPIDSLPNSDRAYALAKQLGYARKALANIYRIARNISNGQISPDDFAQAISNLQMHAKDVASLTSYDGTIIDQAGTEFRPSNMGIYGIASLVETLAQDGQSGQAAISLAQFAQNLENNLAFLYQKMTGNAIEPFIT
jgi:hypothetical protein